MTQSLDVLIIGPAHPYRGGIAETNHELAIALQSQKLKVKLLTFTQLYPNVIFPGKTQFSHDASPKELDIEQCIHAYAPWTWKKTRNRVLQWQPRLVIFRYYTPYLAPVYDYLANALPQNSMPLGLVDNWTPHEPRPWDKLLNRRFGRSMNAFATLSSTVAQELKTAFKKPVWAGFHPIASGLPQPIAKEKARALMQWNPDEKIVLFFGLIRKYKGLDLLLEAFAKPPLKNSSIRLVIVGEFYEPQKKYNTLIQTLGIGSQIEIYPQFADSTMTRNVFSAADVVAQTYKTATQSGVTPLAYHYGKPLLVSDLTGLKTPILQDQSGSVTSLDTTIIAQELAALLNDKKLERYRNNIKAAYPKYQWASFAEALLAFVNSRES